MADNSQQILNDVLSQQRQDVIPDVSEQDYFEVFCAEQVLKDFDLSYDEIQAGIVDGEHDGGVDSVYAFVNGELIYEDFDTTPFKKDVRIELHIIQSKTSGGFSEIPINKLISLTRHLLKLDADFSQITQYNAAVKAAVDNFRTAYRSLASRFPSLKICYYYASKKADTHVHDNLKMKADELKQAAEGLFQDAEVTVEFLGARRLLDLARRRPKTTYELRVSKSLSAVNGHVVLSTLTEYNRFLRGDGEKVKAELFESNVRDFQGNTEVNAEIVNTLRNEKAVEFWWMNNGVTILASRATLNGDTVTIENPQIVNGLQTSTQIARHFQTAEGDDNRNVMVKIVSSDNEETRDKIIKATNSQNAVQPATLRATDKVQRDIEETLKSTGLYYDRRKNYYKNEGKPADTIISIPLMAQAVMSIILRRPDTARARPSSLIKDNAVYSQVFSEAYPISMYSHAAALTRIVDRVLKSRSELSARDRSNLRFYVLFWLSCVLTGKTNPNPADVAKIDVKTVSDTSVEEAADEIWKIYEQLGATDQIAKGTELRKIALEALNEVLKPAHQLPAEEKV
ncbi:AIPR family protein [Aurantimonas marianensis]|uniref:AIPR family protein n=1 Tax=Aurantimonas marianensis TaxID=2920428 RepID=A0A9X2H7K3_9HYPH|nr:AIPR family protein [Aurantimonas marianensis]MCP3055085.1 AIPR family protein [Aurantimonas marianensis]